MPRIVVNGQPLEVEQGSSLLAALQSAGVHVPHLCHDPRLEKAAVCRTCLVELHGAAHPVPSCATPVVDGMVITTHSEALEHSRRGILQMLARRLPSDAAHDTAHRPLFAELRAYGLIDQLGGHASAAQLDTTHPYIRVDMSRCIDCYRCQRICNEVQGQFSWVLRDRGRQTQLVPDSGTSLLESSCVSCGACADTCPTGALEDHSVLQAGPPTELTRTTCPYCGVGCELLVGTRAGRIVQIRPALDAPVNKGHLCVKGRYAFGYVHAPDRLTEPMLRDSLGELRPVSWEQALAFTAQRLQALRAAHGADALGVLGSARATNEDAYLAQKFARVVLGTNNVDCCARVCHAPSAAALGGMLGTGAATNSFDDIERARTILVCGANATENHPIVGARIRQAVLRGAQLIVIDPRRIELTQLGGVHLQLRPGSNVALLNAMAHVILREGLLDDSFVASRVDGLAELRAFVAAFPPERAAAVCGVSAESIEKAARLYATHKPAMCLHGLGMTEHAQGTESVMCLVNLALLTGNLGKPGSGVNPLRGQNNVQGAAHMGCEPAHLPGYATLENGRELFERHWQAPLPTTAGLDLMQMMDAAHAGHLKALYAIGYDVLLTNPNTNVTREALRKLPLVIVQDIFLTETAREFAHVVLPAAASYEKEGTFMNGERRVQRVRKAVQAPGHARADWEIVCALASQLGQRQGFAFRSAEEVWDEVRRVWKAGAGMSYARLDRAGLQWPCPSEDHPGTALLHADSFSLGVRAALRCIDYRPTSEVCDERYPLLLITGRRLHHFNAGTMTGRTRNHELRPPDMLELCAQDAAQHGLHEGERVVVRSRHGSASLPVHIDDAARPGELFTTFHTAQVFLNHVTGPHRDNVTRAPEYKVTAVALERAAQPAVAG